MQNTTTLSSIPNVIQKHMMLFLNFQSLTKLRLVNKKVGNNATDVLRMRFEKNEVQISDAYLVMQEKKIEHVRKEGPILLLYIEENKNLVCRINNKYLKSNDNNQVGNAPYPSFYSERFQGFDVKYKALNNRYQQVDDVEFVINRSYPKFTICIPSFFPFSDLPTQLIREAEKNDTLENLKAIIDHPIDFYNEGDYAIEKLEIDWSFPLTKTFDRKNN